MSKQVLINFKASEELREQMKEYCSKTDNKMSRLLRVAVEEYMKNHPVDEK